MQIHRLCIPFLCSRVGCVSCRVEKYFSRVCKYTKKFLVSICFSFTFLRLLLFFSHTLRPATAHDVVQRWFDLARWRNGGEQLCEHLGCLRTLHRISRRRAKAITTWSRSSSTAKPIESLCRDDDCPVKRERSSPSEKA